MKNLVTLRKIYLVILAILHAFFSFLRKFFLAILPASLFTLNYVATIGNKHVRIAFLYILLLTIGNAWRLTEKNHVTERFLRQTEIAFFLLPISSIVFVFVTGAKTIDGAQGDLQQAGAVIGTALGGIFIVGPALVIGLFGGFIMHVLAGRYGAARYGKDAAI